MSAALRGGARGAASLLSRVVSQPSSSVTSAIDRKNAAARLAFRRGIHEIRFEYHDTTWLRLWQSVAKISFRRSVLPIVQEYMQSVKMEKKHLLNVIYKLRITAKFGQAREICDWMIRNKVFEIEESDHVLLLELVGRISKFQATRCFWEMPAELRSEDAYTAMLQVFARWHAIPAAEDTMSEMKSLNLITRVEPYNIMLDMYKRKNEDDKVRAMYDELSSLGVAPDAHTYLIVLRAKQKIGGFDGIEAEVRKFLDEQLTSRQPLFIYECMLRIYTLLRDLAAIENLRSILLKTFKKFSSSSYNCLLDSYRQLGEVERAERLFNEIGNKFTLNIQSYRAMIAVYASNGRMEKANELYKQLFRAGFECHPAIYHAMVAGYIDARDHSNALIQYGKAWDRSLLGHPKPLRATTLLVLRVLAEQGDFSRAESIVRDLKRERQGSDVEVYNWLLKAYIKAEVPVFGFDGRMLAAGVRPNDESLELLRRINLPAKKVESREREESI
ncbi:pentatricopeptide repeat-containing protein At1g07590, mitochondrial [Selaginella moellendorffii]|nr:pentatricopeptide repeat-containing protein At1g07590, mitochondrial [Selaginella moellendorffii]|eukprot:XP_002981212.2 pentatricopeptide repeat-containing protein At1g07590, mitochondrial [Selaginella moellendorffii]